jgi:hypothetical protein
MLSHHGAAVSGHFAGPKSSPDRGLTRGPVDRWPGIHRTEGSNFMLAVHPYYKLMIEIHEDPWDHAANGCGPCHIAGPGAQEQHL